ncbi:uncharacterized protein LOC114738479 [Neltuma alba]|uniref:uncharacterized protein LOC114738479 n=1 Tax=Neltuma alba TaxID=207710 RepID=UPI0010A38439|nr:uncharacterized protein LOC114738479 [Prosopis alba]
MGQEHTAHIEDKLPWDYREETVMFWNSRGTRAKSFPSLVREIKRHYQIDFLAILETRCDKREVKNRTKKLGFHAYEIIDVEGYSGGIWCLWERSVQHVTILEKNPQFMHVRVGNSQGLSWEMTIIYAHPNAMVRQQLWGELSRLSRNMLGAWILRGDFNATLLAADRRSVAKHKLSSDKDFITWFDQSHLHDLGYRCPEFT